MRISLLLLLALAVFHAVAQNPIEVASKVQSVTVYPRGAQVERVASKFLSSGKQVLAFQGLASELDPSSISVSADGAITVLSVTSKIDELRMADKPKEMRSLEDSLRTFEFDLKFNQNMQAVYAEERKMVLSNQSVGWESSEFVIEDLEDLSDFYRDRLADIMLKEMELQVKQQSLAENIRRVRSKLNEYSSKVSRATGVILVEVQVPSNSTANFKLNYMVQNAGWVPTYNVNVSEIDRPLQVSYNAKVYQNTGVDWEGVTITLTNANPSLSGTKPVIHPWTLYFLQEVLYRDAASNAGYPMAMSVKNMEAMDDAEDFSSQEVQVSYPVNEAVTQFRIGTKHSIPSNGKPQVLSIDIFTVPAKYQYYVAPKLDLTAFLIAKVGAFEQYDLLPGQANLFLANTYVGQAFIDPATTNDTLELSLGRDQSIVVKREKIKEFSASKRIGSTTKTSMGVMITLRNTKGAPINLVIEDQLPISSDKSIEVAAVEISAAKHDIVSGKLTWIKTIQGNSTLEIPFKYDVKYPSDKKINL